MFACLYLPNFKSQAAIRAEPELRGEAVAVVDGQYPLVAVVCRNEKAEGLGVEPGMTRTQITNIQGVQFRSASAQCDAQAQAALVGCAQEFSPRVEETAADTVILDITGLEKLFGAHAYIAKQLTARAQREGFILQVAVASNPDAAMHAARGFAGATIIPGGKEAEILGPLAIEVLRPEAELLAILQQWGIRDFRALAALPAEALSERLGQAGLRLQNLASGASTRPLLVAEFEECFEEEMELEYPVALLDQLAFILNELLERICARLQAHALATNQLTLQMWLEDETECEQKIHFPVPMQEKTVLLKLLHLRLASHALTAPVTKVKLTAHPAEPRQAQEGLFVPDAPAAEKLEVTLARVAKVVGAENVGSPELLDSHRPHAFRMKHFIPPAANAKCAEDFSRTSARLALRIFRPAKKARVLMRKGAPAQLKFDDVSSAVLMAAGPWRASGEWWQEKEQAWAREEGDIALQEGLYRLVKDLARDTWLVEGSYD